MRTNQKSNVGPAAQEHPAVVATKCPRTNYQKPHDRLPRCFAENSRMDDRLSLRSRSIRRRSSDRDRNSIVETADATRETNLAITATSNAPHRARSLEGQTLPWPTTVGNHTTANPARKLSQRQRVGACH